MNVKNVIAAVILGGAMVNFSSCENEEMKSQIEKMLENDSISKVNLATLQKLLEKTQSELQNAKFATDFFAWGEIETKEEYTEENYKLVDKYTDGGELELEDDVAHVKWGGKLRIPSVKDFQELIDECEWEKINEEFTYKIKSKKNENFVFLLNSECWLREINEDFLNNAYYAILNHIYYDDMARYSEHHIRPVCNLK